MSRLLLICCWGFLLTGCSEQPPSPISKTTTTAPITSDEAATTDAPESTPSTASPEPVDLLFSVETVSGRLQEPEALISVRGTANSGGWSSPTLKAVQYIQAPPDGIYDFSLVAQKPSGMATMVMTPIEVKDFQLTAGSDMKGVRVLAQENSITLRFLQQIKELPLAIDPITVTVTAARFEQDVLVLDVSHAGGTNHNHEYHLVWSGIATRSMPPQVNVFLIHDAHDDDTRDDDAEQTVTASLPFALPATLNPSVIRIRTQEDGEAVTVKVGETPE